MRIKVLFFARLRELAQTNECWIELPENAQILDVRSELTKIFPQLQQDLHRAAAALHESYAEDSTLLKDGDEIAWIPPVGGGSGKIEIISPYYQVTDEPLDLSKAYQLLKDPKFGGIVLFSGTVREWTGDRRTEKLEYEAYKDMALLQMHRLGEELETTYPGVKTLAWHRVGTLVPTETAVICAAASAHRDIAFTVCKTLIDRLKKEVPIWKKEFFSDGQTEWKENPE